MFWLNKTKGVFYQFLSANVCNNLIPYQTCFQLLKLSFNTTINSTHVNLKDTIIKKKLSLRVNKPNLLVN